jgi:hypothetical protein
VYTISTQVRPFHICFNCFDILLQYYSDINAFFLHLLIKVGIMSNSLLVNELCMESLLEAE